MVLKILKYVVTYMRSSELDIMISILKIYGTIHVWRPFKIWTDHDKRDICSIKQCGTRRWLWQQGIHGIKICGYSFKPGLYYKGRIHVVTCTV